MVNKSNKIKNFDLIVSESIIEGLSIITDPIATKSFLSFIYKNYRIKEEELINNLDIYNTELEKLFGNNTKKIEKMIIALLYSKIGLKLEENDKKTFQQYIIDAKDKKNFFDNVKESQKVLDDKELKIIHSLQDDARKSVTIVAKETKLSRPTVTKIIDRLINEDILEVKAGINIRDLNYSTACIALECKPLEERRELVKKLSACPRTLMIMEPSDKINLLVFIYGENQNTLKSTIESFRTLQGTSIIDIMHSDPPIKPSAFNIQTSIDKYDISPCNKDCTKCNNYINNECLGCPLVHAYKGPF